jgi:signal transduction histidine kinase
VAGMLQLDVIDTGVGMDAEAVRRAFEPYFSTKTAGSGLGLANARRNVELCGGTMTLASAPGRGTTVTLRLPVADRRDDSAPAR